MEPKELQRLHAHYTSIDDDDLVAALYCGPDAYASSEVWKIIAKEALRRGMVVPTGSQLVEYEAARVAAELADQPPPVPWGWALYILLTRVTLSLLAFYCVIGLAGMFDAAGRREGWQRELSNYVSLLGMVCVVTWARRRQLVALRERLRGRAWPRGEA